MKCLFITSRSPDCLSSCLWDGLQELLGENNVVDAVGSIYLHRSSAEESCGGSAFGHHALRDVSGTRDGLVHNAQDEGGYDILVINSCFNRDQSWEWAKTWRPLLKPTGKVAYVEGWDAAWDINPPQMDVDAVFRREISVSVSYPYAPRHLPLAAPLRWLSPVGVGEEDASRPMDVFFAGNPNSCLPGQPVRWQMLSKVFEAKRVHYSTVSTYGIEWTTYMKEIRRSKLALCPPGADGCDSNRLFEAAATGAIPVIVGMPTDRIRDPWFPGEICFSCTVDQLPGTIDEALNNDQTGRRMALLDYARKHHTTRARAKRLLEAVI